MKSQINPDVIAFSDVGGSTHEAVDFEQGTYTYRDDTGRLVTMDLSPSDVHIDTAAANILVGYRNGGFIADRVSPVVVKDKQSNKYYVLDPADTFQLVQGASTTGPGAAVREISPRLSRQAYSVKPRALASFVPSETESAADTPLRPGAMAAKRVMDALLLGREYRVAKKLTTAANWASGQVITLGSTNKWNGGTASDPIGNIFALMSASVMHPTHLVASYPGLVAFLTNPAVREYTKFKADIPALPNTDAQEFQFPGLPPIIVSTAKYRAADGSLQYIWGNNIAAVRIPPGGISADGQDVATSLTFRWQINAEDARVQQGISVRSFFLEDRGPNGGRKYVVNHYDDERIIDNTVGGLLVGVVQ